MSSAYACNLRKWVRNRWTVSEWNGGFLSERAHTVA